MYELPNTTQQAGQCFFIFMAQFPGMYTEINFHFHYLVVGVCMKVCLTGTNTSILMENMFQLCTKLFYFCWGQTTQSASPSIQNNSKISFYFIYQMTVVSKTKYKNKKKITCIFMCCCVFQYQMPYILLNIVGINCYYAY